MCYSIDDGVLFPDDIPLGQLSDRTTIARYTDYRIKRHDAKEFLRGEVLNKDEVDAEELQTDLGVSSYDYLIHVTSLRSCTCQFFRSWGVPCRHQFCVLAKQGQEHWRILFDNCVHKRWLVQTNTSSSASMSGETGSTLINKPSSLSQRLSQSKKETEIASLTTELKNLALSVPSKYYIIRDTMRTCLDNVATSVATNRTGNVVTLSQLGENTVVVANPPVQNRGRQNRNQGKMPSAPGTASNRKAGKVSKAKRTAAEKSKANKVHGV